MANRYWVYNGGNINDTTHWSATSGGAGGASKPTLSDNVIFDANSFTLNAQVVTLNEAFNCLSMDWTGLSKTVTFSSSVFSLNLYGNLTLAANLTWLFTGTAYLNHKATGTVTTNGIILNANRVYFDAAGITVTNSDNANYGSASFYLTNGTWNTNGKTITSTGSFNTVAGTKTLTLGASIFNIGTWTNTVTAGFTFNYNTSTVNITTASILTGITSFYNLTCSGVATLTMANNITVTNALTLAGSSVSNRLKILSSVAGTQRTVTVPAAGVFPSNLDVQDMSFPNAVDISSIAGYSQDFGNNTGITFTASANLYFKHTSGAANWGDITKWFLADRSTQGRIPLIQDDVNFDSLSFTGTSTLALNIAATCRSMNWTGLNQAVTLSSAVNSLSIYGDTILAVGLIWTFTGTAYVYMKASDARNVTTNGVIPALNKLYFDRVGGSWTNQDDYNIGSSYIGLTNGIWNTNGKAIVTTGMFETLLGTKILTLGASLFKIGTFWDSNTLNLTVNYNTSTVWITTAASLSSNASNFYSLKIEGTIILLSLATANLVVNNVLTLTGINSNTLRLLITSNTIGSQRNITASSIALSNVDFRDIKGLGVANWDLSGITGGSGDCGGNTNITFTASETQYYKYTSGACNWSDAKWYDVARTTLGRIPLPQDDAVFDSLSFTGTSTLTINVVRICRTLNMSNCPSITVNWNGDGNIECYGSLLLNGSINWVTSYSNTGHNLSFFGRGIFYFDAQNKIFNCLNFDGSNITLLSGFSIVNYMYLRSGVIDFNDQDATIPYLLVLSGTCYLGNGVITIPSTGYLYGLNYYGGTLYSEGSTILISPAINHGIIQINIPASRQLNIVKIAGGVSVPSVNFIQGVSINELIIDPGKTVKFTAGTTTTIGKLTAIGTQANPITIGSVTAATHNLIKTGADMVEVEYCNISNSNATPTDKWAGGDTSVDGGGNSGWTFKYIPIVMWFFGIFSKK